jgi:hypothetical protein
MLHISERTRTSPLRRMASCLARRQIHGREKKEAGGIVFEGGAGLTTGWSFFRTQLFKRQESGQGVRTSHFRCTLCSSNRLASIGRCAKPLNMLACSMHSWRRQLQLRSCLMSAHVLRVATAIYNARKLRTGHISGSVMVAVH